MNYLFALQVIKNDGKMNIVSHTEEQECDADAMVRARKVLKEARRDGARVLQIDLYNNGRKHVVSYC